MFKAKGITIYMNNYQKGFAEPIDAHILFMDIVDFSKGRETDMMKAFLTLDEKVTKLVVGSSDSYTLKSTGDGILFIDSSRKIDFLDLAIDLQRLLPFPIRQGIHIGSIYYYEGKKMSDAIGSAINYCQRVMDCGDANHILISEDYKKIVVSTFQKHCGYCREINKKVFDKHGNAMQIYNYCNDSDKDNKNFGNPSDPAKLSLYNKNIRDFSVNGDWAKFINACDIIDLSRELDSTYQISARDIGVKKELNTAKMEKFDYPTKRGFVFNVSCVTFPLNLGTHMDFKGHIVKNKNTKPIGKFPIYDFISEIILFDASNKFQSFFKKMELYIDSKSKTIELFYDNEKFMSLLLNEMSNMEISLSDFKDEMKKQNIEDKDICGKAVLIYTGLSDCFVVDEKGTLPFYSLYYFNPFIDVKLARYLKDNKIKILGIDALQPENPIINISEDPNLSDENKKRIERIVSPLRKESLHSILLNEDIPILENLINLQNLIDKKALLVCPPIKFSNKRECNNDCKEHFRNSKKNFRCSQRNKCDDNSITRAFALILKES